jgi:hypothetical protein
MLGVRRNTINIKTESILKEDAFSLRMSFTDEQIAEWCLTMAMLRYDLIDDILIMDEDKPVLIIELIGLRDPDPSVTYRSKLWEQNKVKVLSITAPQFDYWIKFYLDYYGHGPSEVDHFDMQVYDLEELTFRYVYLTLTVPRMRSYTIVSSPGSIV